MTTFAKRSMVWCGLLLLFVFILPALVQEAPLPVRLLAFGLSVCGLIGAAIYWAAALWEA